MNRTSQVRSFRTQARCVLLAVTGAGVVTLLAGSLTAGPTTQDDQESKILLTRAAMEEYVDLRGVIGREKAKLVEDKEFLADQIEILTEQVKMERAAVAALKGEIDDTSARTAELEAEEAALKAATESLEALVADHEARARALAKVMPAPLQENEVFSALVAGLPADPADTKLSLSSRYVNVTGILDAADKFNADVHVSNENRELGNGESVNVDVLYLGVSTAFFVNQDGTIGGTGRPGEDGYVWRQDDVAAPAIKAAIAMKEGDTAAAFVQLPVKVD